MLAPDPSRRSVAVPSRLPRLLHCAISWSKTGIICYSLAGDTGPNLNITFLENIDGKNWQLAPAQTLTIRPVDTQPAQKVVFVQWSNISTDLAVFDELGNFYILLAGVGLLQNRGVEKLTPTPKPIEEPETPPFELTSYNHTEMIYRDVQPLGTKEPSQGSCIAFKWLPVEKPHLVNKLAKWSAESNAYVYGIEQYKPLLLAHPVLTKQACLAVRRSGIINLYYQGEHKVEYHKLTIDLGTRGSSAPLQLAKALIGFTADKKIVITAYDTALGLILTYSVLLDWGFLVNSALRQSKDPHYHTPKEEQTAPTISAELVHQMRPVAMNVDMERALDATPQEADTPPVETASLVLIDILSPYHAQTEHVEVLITYEHFSAAKPVVSFTTQRFWCIDLTQNLAGCFSAVCSSSAAPTSPLYTLQLQDKMTVPGRLREIHLALSESMVLFELKSGDFLPISRATWAFCGETTLVKSEPLEPAQQPQSVTMPAVTTIASLLDCGFRFPQLLCARRSFACSVSPNMTCVAYLEPANDALSLVTLDRGPGSSLDTVCVALAHTHAHACYSNACSDDLMLVIKAEHDRIAGSAQQQQFLDKLNVEAHGAIHFHLSSFGKESVHKLLSNPPLQKLLLLQLVLSDLSGNRKTREIAWVVLNLRFTSFGIMFTLSSIYRQLSKKNPAYDTLEDSAHRAEYVYLLIGNVKWLVDFVIYLNQELTQLLLLKQNPGDSLVTMHNSIALPVLLSKIPRLFLMYALSSIGKTHEILKKLHKNLSERNKLFTLMKDAIDRLFSVCTSPPWKMAAFEAFLRECESHILKELAPKLAERELMIKLEQDLFCRGEIPAEYALLAELILDRHALSIGRDSRLSDLFLYDTSWIAIGPATPYSAEPMNVDSTTARKTHGTVIRHAYSKLEAVDALRKILITCPSQVRKCVRCRSVSLVAYPQVFDTVHVVALWTMVFQRTCLCGSAWVNCRDTNL
ncbi:hypothetical protein METBISCDRAFT_11921 [Metschnikowia bicuspidata]|uniref:Mediator of RNA polymerase II transcription subunit 16 n=1 Tax=Metschnikowia bicuspidata TaxID=27322 RepID=A0A4P9ZHP6_9ASCO|nr:hypothetical protein METBISCDRAFT_11921 [Metschnikowia bicuspidata]